MAYIYRGRKIGGTGGDGPFQNFNWGGGTEVLKFPSKFFNSFLSILVLQCHFFTHLQNNTVGNTGIDAAGLVHVYLLVDLDLHVMLLENSRNIVGLMLVYTVT